MINGMCSKLIEICELKLDSVRFSGMSHIARSSKAFLTAMGINSEDAIGAIRLSFGRVQETVDLPIDALVDSVNNLRSV